MKVLINQIRPNAFQVRKYVDRERVQALADEIKALGYWGSLRARKQGSFYELCFGHRRLEALKILKVKEVDLEIVDLSDDEMASEALVENLQREGLTDIEKAEGIQRLIERFEADGDGKAARERVTELMGLSKARIGELLSMSALTRQSKHYIATRKISGGAAIRALQLGGEEMIATAVRHTLPQKTIQAIQQELIAIPEPKVREKVTRAVVAGRVRDAESVREQVRKVSRQEAERAGTKVPSDLKVVIRSWTQTMTKWAKQLEAVLPYVDYIEEDIKGAAEFKTATRELIDKLKRFL